MNDLRNRPETYIKTNTGCRGECIKECGIFPDVGSAEPVDGLLEIADDEKAVGCSRRTGKTEDQIRETGIIVLYFINKDVSVSFPKLA